MKKRNIAKHAFILTLTLSACRITDYGCIADGEISTIEAALEHVAELPYEVDTRIRTPAETEEFGGDCEDKGLDLANIIVERIGHACELWYVQSWQVYYETAGGEQRQVYHLLVYDLVDEKIYEPTSGYEYKTKFALQVIKVFDYEEYLWYAVHDRIPRVYDTVYP